jgi:hypothetical protein
MKSRWQSVVLGWMLAGAASGLAAQEDCSVKINTMEKIGDIQAALRCLDSRMAADSERARAEAEKSHKQMLARTAGFDITIANVRNVSLDETTNGVWKEIPDSESAHACFLGSVRLPLQGLCQISYQGAQERWVYNISDPKRAGFMCTATCIWMGLVPKPQPKE